ncbi:MAG: mannose/fructose/sorbose PTS transporter subunit IIA [Bacillus sp. (in: firmicutes)]
MSKAILVGTHGSTAEQLIKTTEMIIGSQENVESINFLPNENSEILIQKFNEKLEQLNTEEGVIFMVDLFGGSPFNAASQIAMKHDNYDVITGVNVPMLLETLLTRQGTDIHTLTAQAVEAGITGIKSLKASLSDNEESEEEL